MTEQPQLSQAEWEVIVSLLRSEQRELATEIHHTSQADMRRELQDRLHLVNGLLEKLPSPSPSPA